MKNDQKKTDKTQSQLDAYDLVEITNEDGSKSQISREEATRRVEEAKKLESQLNK